MRLFIAINLENEAVKQLLAVQNLLREAPGGGNFSRPENLHLTLSFLGEVEPRRAADAIGAMEAVSVPAFPLTFDRAGRFRREDGDIWWVGAQRSAPLLKLQNELVSALKAAGFPQENREFLPHVTLARRILLPKAPELMFAPIEAWAGGISLMESGRAQGRLVYTERYSRPLAEP